jgi:hypothetical protein
MEEFKKDGVAWAQGVNHNQLKDNRKMLKISENKDLNIC